ncbi:hypothetical protein yc1106_06819 [Curvularia clavata]|uniref:Uncharacterized protein n=1 Tax=Curvularia clavata TaxID=95742 RepID=A0A9Q8ZC72_CURCL|nr:hypothetical protein yc1106_06819 [Curvularia clavata]
MLIPLFLFLLSYLATTVSSSPISFPTATTTNNNDAIALTPRDLPKCPTTHLPTLPQYLSAATTFCKHFTPSLSLDPNKPITYTYLLTDAKGNTLPWILSMVWEQGDFLGGGKMEVTGERCRAWFEAAVKDGTGEWMCREGLVKGGRRNAVGGEKGAKVWVETRRKRGA